MNQEILWSFIRVALVVALFGTPVVALAVIIL